MNRFTVVCETQSYGHYTPHTDCGHRHRSKAAAERCADRWTRRERRIRAEQQTLDNGSRMIVTEAR